MSTVVERHQSIFGLQALFHQPHVVLLAQRVKREYGSQDRRGFDTDEHGGMNTARNDRAINCDDKQVECMFIDLADLCWVGDREYKGLRRGAFSRRVFEARAGFDPL